MGTRIQPETSVSIQLHDASGAAVGLPIQTEFVALSGTSRNTVTGGPEGLSDEERDLEGGSKDWLTTIHIADSQATLQDLVRTHRPAHDDDTLTSASSMRVGVHIKVGNRTENIVDAITIADGTRHEDLTIDVDTIHVFPSPAALKQNVDMKAKFIQLVDFGRSLD